MHLELRAVALAAACAVALVATARAQDIHPDPEHARDETEPVRIGGALVPLPRLLRHAMRAAPALAVARARVGLADEALGAAAPFLPNPTLSAGAGPRFGANGAVDVDVQAGLQVPIEIAGQRPLRFALARAARRTRRMQLEQTRWEVHQRVHAGYRAALVERERATLARRIAHFQEDLVEITRRRVEAGEAAPLQLRLAEAEAAQARQRAIAALQSYREACLRLAEVSGWSASEPPEPVGQPDAPRPAPPLSRLLELARAHNPVLDVRRAAIDEARARLALADREAWPTPALGVQYARESAPEGGTPEDSVVGVLTIPLPLFAQNQAERAASAAQLEVALAEHDAIVSVLSARLEALRTAVDAAVARVSAYGRDILPRFADNLQLLRRAFEIGEIDLLQISLALERFLSIQSEALDAYVDYATAMAALEAEIGAELPEGPR